MFRLCLHLPFTSGLSIVGSNNASETIHPGRAALGRSKDDDDGGAGEGDGQVVEAEFAVPQSDLPAYTCPLMARESAGTIG
jgi:hypothetical protein